ncbi:MAG: DNA-directed RNA polymerase subunit omega [bacterium]|nr:DNA-directed RNA polymerase subunit omega [bacterium]
MIELLKDDTIIHKVGGRFKLTALIQKRWLELMRGSRPMVEHEGLSELETVIKEIAEGKVAGLMPAESEEGDEAEA